MKYLSRYSLIYIDALLYMLQGTEYKLRDYFTWYHRTRDFRTVMKRRGLDHTSKVRLLRLALRFVWLIFVLFIIFMGVVALNSHAWIHAVIALLALLTLPYVLAYGVAVPLFLGRVFIQLPKERKMIRSARRILASHPGVKIAVVGSYGKTTVKELLATVLSEGKTVATTPGNMNTPIGISRFARKLTGKEDVLVIEFGEEKPGDVWKLSQLVKPTMAVVTGINEAHLSSFKSLEQTTETIMEIVTFLGPKAKVYKNIESKVLAKELSKNDKYAYDRTGTNGWKVTEPKTSLQDGTHFTVSKDAVKIKVRTSLIGLHNIGPTVAVISIADQLGLSPRKIETGLRKVKPFEHRMEPRQLHGAWIIDDTYNGNSDGVAAGLALLKTTKAKRRIYVTPGLVEVGHKTAEVHETIGKQIAGSADMVVLMNNSVTRFIQIGLQAKKFKGELLIIDNPLDFYANIDQFVAAGDVVLMQNDWTDNYQ